LEKARVYPKSLPEPNVTAIQGARRRERPYKTKAARASRLGSAAFFFGVRGLVSAFETGDASPHST